MGMPGSDYYRQQAKVLLAMAQATSDPERAARLKVQAELYLAQAEIETPDGSADVFNRAVDEYNDDKMRGD
jgi:hypothetical protein